MTDPSVSIALFEYNDGDMEIRLHARAEAPQGRGQFLKVRNPGAIFIAPGSILLDI